MVNVDSLYRISVLSLLLVLTACSFSGLPGGSEENTNGDEDPYSPVLRQINSRLFTYDTTPLQSIAADLTIQHRSTGGEQDGFEASVDGNVRIVRTEQGDFRVALQLNPELSEEEMEPFQRPVRDFVEAMNRFTYLSGFRPDQSFFRRAVPWDMNIKRPSEESASEGIILHGQTEEETVEFHFDNRTRMDSIVFHLDRPDQMRIDQQQTYRLSRYRVEGGDLIGGYLTSYIDAEADQNMPEVMESAEFTYEERAVDRMTEALPLCTELVLEKTVQGEDTTRTVETTYSMQNFHLTWQNGE